PDQVQALVRTVRGVEVILDKDVARLLGISLPLLTDYIDQNPPLFPDDFVFSVDGRQSMAFTEHAIAHVVRGFNSPERGMALVAILRGFVQYRRFVVLAN